MKVLECCAGVESERWLRTLDHIRVSCDVCSKRFCLDRIDLETDLFTSTHKYDVNSQKWKKRRALLKPRPWFCSLDCMHAAHVEE